MKKILITLVLAASSQVLAKEPVWDGNTVTLVKEKLASGGLCSLR